MCCFYSQTQVNYFLVFHVCICVRLRTRTRERESASVTRNCCSVVENSRFIVCRLRNVDTELPGLTYGCRLSISEEIPQPVPTILLDGYARKREKTRQLQIYLFINFGSCYDQPSFLLLAVRFCVFFSSVILIGFVVFFCWHTVKF